MAETTSTSVAELELRLWLNEPTESWLRKHGRTRVLLIDDQWCSRQRFFDVADSAPSTSGESFLCDWLNVDLQFFPMPEDYEWEGPLPSGNFSGDWFEQSLLQVIRSDTRPVSAILLDLLFGDKEHSIENASGRRFLGIIRKHLPDVPVLVLTNVRENREVLERLKTSAEAVSIPSFQDYIPKVDPDDIDQDLLERIAHKLVWWADLSDPAICAFSPKMRRLARQMRQIVLRDERINYEVAGRGDFPRPVTLEGGFGTGKSFLAEHLIAMSRRWSNPHHTVTFSGATEEGIIPTLFGSSAYTGAPFYYWVDPADGAVLGMLRAGQQNPFPNAIPLGQLGVLHQADVAGQPIPSRGQRQQPLRGSVVLDELGLATEKMQGSLLEVFNIGRFRPHLSKDEIPTQRSLDVWFIVTISPRTRERMLEDLENRLIKSHKLTIPDLKDRREDLLPLVLTRMPAPRPESPDEVFTQEAVEWLESSYDHLQVRNLIAMLLHLPDVTAKRPYGRRDLEEAFAATETRRRPIPAAETKVTKTPSVAAPDALECLTTWRESHAAPFPNGVDAKEKLRGRGVDIDGGAAAARLAYLELAINFTEGVNGELFVTRVYEFAYGDSANAQPARDRLAGAFQTDEAESLEAIRRSDRLARLAIDVTKRQKKVGKLLEQVAEEPDQRDRLVRLGWNP